MILQYVLEENVTSGPLFQSLKQLEELHTPAAPAIVAIGDESERGEGKSWLKDQHSKNEDHGIRFHHFMGNRWGNSGNSVRLYFFGLQNHCRW